MSRSIRVRYAAAVASVALALALKLLLDEQIGRGRPFLLFYSAVIFSAWFGGLGPGLLATGLAALVTNYFFLFPYRSFTTTELGILTQMAVFTLEGALISVSISSLRVFQRRAETNLAEAEGRQRSTRQQNEERFRLVLDGVRDYSIVMLDRDGNLNSWNAGAERIKGYRSEDILGRHFSCFYSEEDKALGKPQRSLSVAAAEGRFEEEGLRVRGDGTSFVAHVVITALRDEAGELLGFAKITRDITESRRTDEALRREKEFSERLIHSSIDGILAFDRDFLYTIWNPAMEAFSGVKAEEALGRCAFDVLPFLKETGADQYFLQTLLGKVVFVGESPFSVPDLEREGYFEGCFSPLHGASGEIIGGLAIIRDVTDRRKAEEERARRIQEQAARADVEASEQRYRSLAEAIPQMVWTAQPDGRPDYFNERWFEFTGLSTEQNTDRPARQSVIHPDDVAEAGHRWEESVRTGEAFEFEYRFRRASDQSYRWHLARALPVRDASGRIIKWFGTATDIHDQKGVEEQMRSLAEDNARLYREAQGALQSKDEAVALLDTLLSRAPVGFAFLDRELRYVRINDALAVINGVNAEEHIGRTPRDLLSPELYQQVGPIYQRVLATGQAVLDREVRGQTRALPNVSRDWLCNYYPVRSHDGELLGLGIVVIEITDRKRVEKELQSAKETAEAASRAKDEFLAVLSHELRTPLTPVLATVSAMLDDPSTPVEVLPVIAMMRRNVELEARLIDDLLDVTRISQGKLQLLMEVVDAHSVIHQALEICRGEIYSGQLRLTVSLAAVQHHVKADPARLQQVFWNLIKNAVKFTPEGGTITVRSRNEEPEGGAAGRLVVEIGDTGIGIEPEVLPKIFNVFEQGEAAITRRFGGLGLGLPISRSVIEAHGGRLTATSGGKNQGAVLQVDLATVPARVADSKLPAPATPGTLPPRSLRILLVEDHEDTARTMAKLLRHHHFLVKTANTVVSALEMASAEDFDLLISDIGLPDGSGLDLMRLLRSRHAVKGIALSGFGMDDDIRKSQEAGFVAHLTKPIDYRKLEAMIQKVTSNIERTTVAP